MKYIKLLANNYNEKLLDIIQMMDVIKFKKSIANYFY